MVTVLEAVAVAAAIVGVVVIVLFFVNLRR